MSKHFESVVQATLWPLAVASYFVLHYIKLSSVVPGFILPTILGIIITILLLFLDTMKYLTAIFLILELSAITVFGLLIDMPEIRTPSFTALVSLGVMVFWAIYIYAVLSSKGMSRKDMGHLGEMANGIVVMAKGIGVMMKRIADGVSDGIGEMARGLSNGIKEMAGGVSDGIKEMARGVSDGVGIFCCGDGDGNPADARTPVCPPPYQFSTLSDKSDSISELKPSLEV